MRHLREEFRHLGIDFVSYQENIDTSSPLGSAIFTVISAVAQLERDIIAERVKAGLRRKGPEQRQKAGQAQKASVDVEKVRQLRSQGLSLREIADRVGVSHTKVSQVLNK